MPFVEVAGVSKNYQVVRGQMSVVRGVNLVLALAERVAIGRPSGT